VAEPDGIPQEAWIRLGAVQEIVRTPNQTLFHRNLLKGCLRQFRASSSNFWRMTGLYGSSLLGALLLAGERARGRGERLARELP
jgi:hypothetical protein